MFHINCLQYTGHKTLPQMEAIIILSCTTTLSRVVVCHRNTENRRTNVSFNYFLSQLHNLVISVKNINFLGNMKKKKSGLGSNFQQGECALCKVNYPSCNSFALRSLHTTKHPFIIPATVIGFISSNSETTYREEVKNLKRQHDHQHQEDQESHRVLQEIWGQKPPPHPHQRRQGRESF